jgi:hypothetical protein
MTLEQAVQNVIRAARVEMREDDDSHFITAVQVPPDVFFAMSRAFREQKEETVA